MRNQFTLLFFALIVTTAVVDGVENQLIDSLLIQELEKTPSGVFQPSWAYSNEGGVIQYAEVDIVGDDRKEIIYSRSSRGYIRGMKSGSWTHEIYFKPDRGEKFVRLSGKVFLDDFQKKEGEQSIFIRATEGRNFAVGDEAAFTKKLIIQKVSESGVDEETIIINDETDSDLRKMWEAALFPYEKKSAETMKDLGFGMANPKYKWISLKDYLEGGEWKDNNVNDWSSLNEFSIEGVSWLVHQDLITPDFLEFARRILNLKREGNSEIRIESLDFPNGYLTPSKALKYLGGRDPERVPNSSDRVIKNSVGPGQRGSSQPSKTQAALESEQKPSRLAWIIAGALLVGILALLLKTFRGKSTS